MGWIDVDDPAHHLRGCRRVLDLGAAEADHAAITVSSIWN